MTSRQIISVNTHVYPAGCFTEVIKSENFQNVEPLVARERSEPYGGEFAGENDALTVKNMIEKKC
jgi:hypothetical protein